jgi:hypothetical protein
VFFARRVVMYPDTALRAVGTPPRKSVDTLPVCVFFSDGEKVYAMEASWQNFFDFFKMDKTQYEVQADAAPEEWRSANKEAWGVRFHEPVRFCVGVNTQGYPMVTLRKGTWKSEYVLYPGKSRLVSHKWVRGRHFIIQQPWCSFKD